jgi:hypothetical protein
MDPMDSFLIIGIFLFVAALVLAAVVVCCYVREKNERKVTRPSVPDQPAKSLPYFVTDLVK